MGKQWVALTALLMGIGVTTSWAGPDLTVGDLAWPSTTQSVATRGDTKVFDAAKGDKIGKIAKGRRLAWKRIVSTRDKCKAWLEIEPRGWVCAKDVAPSDEPPTVDGPAEPPAADAKFADIRGDSANAYRSKADIRAGVVAQVVPGETFVSVRKSIRVDGAKYYKTDKGYIASDKLRWLSPSDFTGIDLVATPPTTWPFAWASPAKKGGTVAVRAAPKKKAKKLRELARREVVAVLETKKKFARIGDGEWVALSELRVARTAAPPDGLADGERWIDVDLDQQVLIAYEGATPVFATLVSSGRKKHPTPTGIHRIARKYTKTRMRNPKTSRVATWDVAEVPFAMKFRKNFALHGAYWHDGFGKVKSHGCVNLSPRDAQRVFDWVSPVVASGWTEASDERAGDGTAIRIRSKRDPEPRWKNFDGERLSTKLAKR